ncbi:MAG TPA: ATP-grasp domain-containing protein [Flavitalea sp.]|nr:ATP-grasp domain-containing protein [Flavitalea sp.]
MTKALIGCYGNFRTLPEVPFVLKKGGCNVVDILCSGESSLLRNSYYDNWIRYDKDKEDYANKLIAVAEHNNYDWIILGDEHILKLMNERITSESVFKKMMPLIKIENRMILSSKVGLSDVCERLSITTPRYLVIKGIDEITEATFKLRFPVLVKQDVSTGGQGIFFCNNNEELYHTIKNNTGITKAIIQEYIKGRDIGVEALYKNGQLLTYNVSEVLEYLDGRFGTTTKRKYLNNIELEILLVELGQKVGINGFASIQYIYDERNRVYYLIEADLRPNIWVAASRFTGNDFSTGVRRFLGLLPITPECYKPVAGYNKSVEVLLFNRDLVRCFKKKKFGQFLRWFIDPTLWKFIPAYDGKLLRYQLVNTLKDIWAIMIVYLKTHLGKKKDRRIRSKQVMPSGVNY